MVRKRIVGQALNRCLPSASDYHIRSCISYNLYYVKSKDEKRGQTNNNQYHSHVAKLLSDEKMERYRVLQWCLVVAHLEPDSPRLAYYVSRWRVPEKIASALANGTFDEIVKGCRSIDLRHLPAAAAALEEWEKYRAPSKPAAEIILKQTQKTRLQA